MSKIKERNCQLIADMRSGSELSRTSLIEENTGLVYTVARKMQGHGLPMEDMIQEGVIGLIQAIDRIKVDKTFNPEKFSPYACETIYYSILLQMSRKSQTVSLTDHVCRKIGRMRKAKYKLSAALGRDPYEEEIAEEMGIKPIEVCRLIQIVEPALSMFGNSSDPEADTYDCIEDKSLETSSEIAERISLRQCLDSVYSMLSEEQMAVMAKRFGLDGEEEKTTREVAILMGRTTGEILEIEESYQKIILESDAGAALRAHVSS